MTSLTAYSVDRPRFCVVAISAASPNNVYVIPDVTRFDFHKDDGGDAGTFFLEMPVRKEYLSSLVAQSQIADYAQVAMYMDLIAIFGWRMSTGQPQADLSTANQPPDPGFDFAGLQWGSLGTIEALSQLDSCICIGLADKVSYDAGFSTGKALLTIDGRDLTKVFLINDSGIPDVDPSGVLGGTQSQAFFGLGQIQIEGYQSATNLIESILDLVVAKDLVKVAGETKSTLVSSPQIAANYKLYGFPWRNFIQLDKVDPNYIPLPLSANAPGAAPYYPPYNPQSGSCWDSINELAVRPLSRLFIDERGFLIFDQALNAWTKMTPIGHIQPSDVRDWKSNIDDSTLVTFLSCLPGYEVGQANLLGQVQGQYQPGSTFVNGIMAARNAEAANVQTYGYRYGQFSSPFIANKDDALIAQATLLQIHNNLWKATLTVKGDARYRVGQRYFVDIPDIRPETTQVNWYVTEVEHTSDFGDDWTTQLTLRYPTANLTARPQART